MNLSNRSGPEARRLRTVIWIVALATVGLIFDGYDLVVYGAVVSTFLRDPTQIGNVTPAIAGRWAAMRWSACWSGALLAGMVGDILGRRKVMLFVLRLVLGRDGVHGDDDAPRPCSAGCASSPASASARWSPRPAALVAEYAPEGQEEPDQRDHLFGGIPLGSLLAALLAILLMQHIGWRGMFWIGALPIVTLLPLAVLQDAGVGRLAGIARPAGRGPRDVRAHRRRRCPKRFPTAPGDGTSRPGPAKAGFAGLFSRHYLFPTIVLGLMSATGLVLVYSLNTWLPELMLRAGFNAKGSLSFLAGAERRLAVRRAGGSRAADRFGPKPVVAGVLRDRGAGARAADARLPARPHCWPSSRSSGSAPAARRR